MSSKINQDLITVGIAQISPVWLNREQTLKKILQYVSKASDENCDVIVFGEALLPGYPFWIQYTNGARFDSEIQKEMHAWYLKEAVCIEEGHLDNLCQLASDKETAIYLGTIERPSNRGGHSLYCSLVYINPGGEIKSVHRKLMPTYEERLSWASGDGHGLKTHKLGPFRLGGLNCWENWMPLARSALYAQGENLHVAVWPGGTHNTEDITRFIARESRSFVISASGILKKADIPENIPHSDLIKENCPDILANGGSCIAGPDGEWVAEPVSDKEQLIVATLNHQRILEERQNFDPSGHYSRPDVLSLNLNTERQSGLNINPKEIGS